MKLNKLILVGILTATSIHVAAKESDLLQEVKISAASQYADIKNNQVIFKGPVEVTQGSIKIKADELRAFSKPDNAGKVLVAEGNPATYSQIMEDDRPASASAKEISYELSTRTLTLKGNATLEQEGSQVTGNLIRYNIEQQQLVAEGKKGDRVITIIQPENYQEVQNSPAKREQKQKQEK